MANPIQQGLKLFSAVRSDKHKIAAMANPIQQGLKRDPLGIVPKRPLPSRNG